MVLLVIFLETKLGDRADYLPSGCVREWEIPIYGNISRDEDDGDDDDDFTEKDTFSKWIETS